MKRPIYVVITIIILQLFTINCATDLTLAETDKNINEIKIGLLIPESGTAAWVKALYPGVDLAMKEINDAGGPLGRKLSYIKKDTESSGEMARVGAKELIDSGVVAIVGPTSAEIFGGCMDVAKENRVPMISPTAGTTKLDGMKDRWIFRTTSSDKVMALGMAVEARILGLEKIAIFVANTGSGESIGNAIMPAVKKVGGEVVEKIIFEEGKGTYKDELTKLFAKKPDVIFWEASAPEAKIIFKERGEMGLGGLWIGTDYANEDFVNAVAPTTNIDGILAVVPSPGPGVRLDKWQADLKAATGADGVPVFSAQAYDAINIIALSIEAGGSADKESMYKMLRKVANPPGILVYSFKEGAEHLRKGEDIDYIGIAGRDDFGESGDAIVDHVVKQIKGDKLIQIGVLTQDELGQYTEE